MSVGTVAFLLGLFGVPLVLLMTAHKLRRRREKAQRAFWGAAIGHCIAAVLALVWGMIPPEAWTEGDVARGLAGFWALLALPIIGAAAGAFLRADRRPTA
ncbi:MAG: hypothetical protein P3A28_01325 [Gemmatimonadota bacterium]|nr:hypothetical protein [Gemmatimonadota bacterium]